MIYLDHAATTPVPKAVADAMYTVLTEQYANPNAQYPFGQEMRRSVEDWRAVIAKAVDCEANQLFFTSCGTEGDNWAIRAACWQNRHVGRHIVTTAVEHHAVLNCCQQLEQEGWEVTTILPDQNGDISAESVLAAVRPDTALVSVMMVNNELGSIYPIADIAKGLKAVNEKTLLHTDAVQGFLKVPFSAKALGADFIAISGHKVGAPKGIGALYIGPRVRNPRPLLPGGGQEMGLRSGTEATAQIAGFAKAVELGSSGGQAPAHGRGQGLRRGKADGHSGPPDYRGRQGPPCPVRFHGGLAQSERGERSGQSGHLRLRRLRLSSWQVQPGGGGAASAQAGGRRCHPAELRPGDYFCGHRRLRGGSPESSQSPDAHAIKL